jgi:hypothetical protein
MNTVMKEYIIQLVNFSYNINNSNSKSTSHPKDEEDLKCNKSNVHSDMIRYIKDIPKIEEWLSTIDRKNISEDEFFDFYKKNQKKVNTEKINFDGLQKYLSRLYIIKDINYILPDLSQFPNNLKDIKNNNKLYKFLIEPVKKNTILTISQKGMENTTGNHCWLSSGLQMILSIPEFRTVFLNLRETDISKINISNKSKLDKDLERLSNINKFLKQFNNKDSNNIIEKINYINNELKIISKEYFLRPLLRYVQLMMSPDNSTFDINIPYENGQSLRDRFFEIFQAGPTEDDATQIIQKVFECLEYDNPNIFGLYQIFNVNRTSKLYCKYDNISSSNSNSYIPINLDPKYDSVQMHFDKLDTGKKRKIIDPNAKLKELDCNWKECLNEYDGRPHDEQIDIEILSNTRYLFIRPVNISYEIDGNTGQFNFKRVRSYTNINGSIKVKNVKFNLHGAIIYSGSGGSGHYLYHLYNGDGTTNLLAVYNDSTFSNSSSYNLNEGAYLVVYVRK